MQGIHVGFGMKVGGRSICLLQQWFWIVLDSEVRMSLYLLGTSNYSQIYSKKERETSVVMKKTLR